MEGAPGTPTGPARWSVPGSRFLLRASFLVVVAAFGVYFVVGRWDELVRSAGRFSLWLAAPAAAVAAVALLFNAQTYRTILADLGSPLSYRVTARLFFISQLGKYIPGSVWAVVALVGMSREHKVSRTTAAASGLLALAVSVANGLTIAIVLLSFSSPDAARRFWYVGFAVPILVVGLHPKVIGATLDVALRALGRAPMPRRLSYRAALRATVWQTAGWLLMGLHLWVLVVAIGAPVARSLPIAVGGFALASCAGVLFIPAPAGVGVRDAVLVIVLAPVLDSTAAFAVALASRVVLLLADVLQAGVWAWTRSSSGSPLPVGAAADQSENSR